jgi:glucose-1-phosphate cytidylyltransferase
VVILAGGLGTRLGEETLIRPKPMVEIGGRPIIWHIMKMYSHFGYNDFVILLGFKGHVVREFFLNYFYNSSDITVDLSNNCTTVHQNVAEPWKVTLVETGPETMTAGRIVRAKKYLQDAPFMLTYGDGVSDIDVRAVHDFHVAHGKIATLSAVVPEGRFGALKFDHANGVIQDFMEKPEGDGGMVNGGFMVFQPQIFDYLEAKGEKSDEVMLEHAPMKRLVAMNQLVAYQHHGFWQCMDTQRDKEKLNSLWMNHKAPWAHWDALRNGHKLEHLRVA